MKKFLQKTLAVLALCLVSMGAWADTVVEFDYNQGDGLSTTRDDVTVAFSNNGWILYGNGYGCYVGSSGTYSITVSADSDIKSIVIDNADKSVNGTSYINFGKYYIVNWSVTSGSLSEASNGNAVVSSIPAGVTSVTITMTTPSTNVNQITVTVADAVAADPMDYSVVVTGISDPNAGVVYKGTTVHDGETLHGVVGLTTDKVAPVEIAGYEASVSLEGTVFTVTYNKFEYIPFDTTTDSSGVKTIDITQDGVRLVATGWNYKLDFYSGQPVTISSPEAYIEKVVFVYSGTLPSMTCSTGSFDRSTNTWNIGSSQPTHSVTIEYTGWSDYLVSEVRVWVRTPEPTPAPEFPEVGVAYEVKNIVLDKYVNIKVHATEAGYVDAEKEKLYFTWDENVAGFTIQDEEGNYLGKSTANGWNISSTTPDYWTVEEVSTGVYAFKSQSSNYLAPNKNDGTDNRLMRDKTTSAAYTFTIVPFVAPAPTPVATFNMSAAGWATLCVQDAFTVPDGYEAYVVGKEVNREAVAVENGELVMTRIYDVPEQVAVLITGAPAENIELFAPDATPVKPSVNFLKGNPFASPYPMSSDMFTNDAPTDDPLTYDYIDQYGAGSRIYKLSYLNGENLGFYFDAEGGVSYTVKANRACLVLPAAQANSNGFKIRFTEDDVTGINAVATEKAEAIYNLQGQRVNAAKAGVYVKNGKKFIVK